jgi:hypothetical protein
VTHVTSIVGRVTYADAGSVLILDPTSKHYTGGTALTEGELWATDRTYLNRWQDREDRRIGASEYHETDGTILGAGELESMA